MPSSANVGPITGTTSSVQPKYSFGTGIATEGGLMDSILPYVEDPQAPPYDRKKWPSRIARNETDLASRRDWGGSDTGDASRDTRAPQIANDTTDLREAILAGPDGYDISAAVDGVLDLKDTEDTDRDVQWAPGMNHFVLSAFSD